MSGGLQWKTVPSHSNWKVGPSNLPPPPFTSQSNLLICIGWFALNRDRVTFYVGDQRATLVVHRDLLTLHSEQFANNLAKPDIDDDVCDSVITFSSVLAIYLQVFVSGIYTGNTMTLSTKIEDLIQRWMLGAKFQTPAFQNHVMKSIRWGFKNQHGPC